SRSNIRRSTGPGQAIRSRSKFRKKRVLETRFYEWQRQRISAHAGGAKPSRAGSRRLSNVRSGAYAIRVWCRSEEFVLPQCGVEHRRALVGRQRLGKVLASSCGLEGIAQPFVLG